MELYVIQVELHCINFFYNLFTMSFVLFTIIFSGSLVMLYIHSYFHDNKYLEIRYLEVVGR